MGTSGQQMAAAGTGTVPAGRAWHWAKHHLQDGQLPRKDPSPRPPRLGDKDGKQQSSTPTNTPVNTGVLQKKMCSREILSCRFSINVRRVKNYVFDAGIYSCIYCCSYLLVSVFIRYFAVCIVLARRFIKHHIFILFEYFKLESLTSRSHDSWKQIKMKNIIVPVSFPL